MANKLELINTLKSNPNNQSFLNLVAYLEFRLATIQRQWPMAIGIEEISKLQGRALELTEFLAYLRRVPVTKQYSGSFDT